MTPHQPRKQIAVVGSGVSGLTAAYLLSRDCDVVVFEADERPGGHAHTHTVDEHRIDSGFIVHNDRTYPYLRRLFAELDIAVQPTEMSMSISCDECGLEYAGGRGFRGIFAQTRRLVDPRYLRLLVSIKRFQRLALTLLQSPEGENETFGEFLDRHGFSDYFVAHYAIPVVACVWSSGADCALDYPARYLFTFLRHHGFLSVSGSPQWFTVSGGSHTYIDKIIDAIGDVRVSTPIRSISRGPDGVRLELDTGDVHHADQVVIATHADQALQLLSDPTDDEKRILDAFGYSHNETVLHRDGSVLPEAPEARAAWNYRLDNCDSRNERTAVTYWMNRLQSVASKRPILVTLNATDALDPSAIVATMHYTHPIYTRESVAAAAELPSLTSETTAYAGAYHGWGFHEDGCRSGVEAARSLGVSW